MKISINQDTFIIIAIILVALISFGIGRLTSPKEEPIQIMNLDKASVEEIKIPAEEEQESGEIDYKGRVIASSRSETHLTITT